MKKSLFLFCIALGMVAVNTGQAFATSITTTYVPGNNRDLTSVSSWTTRGIDMGGLEVTATIFNSNTGFTSTETAIWGASGSVGTGWSLSMVDMIESTFLQTQWSLDVTDSAISLTSVELFGGSNVVFDTWFWDVGVGTTGSAYGLDFRIDEVLYNGSPRPLIDAGTTADLGSLNVVYSDSITLNGAAAVGDLWQTMTIDFDTARAFGVDDKLSFWADSDNVRDPVPEPTTMLLLGTGLIGLVGGRRLRKKK